MVDIGSKGGAGGGAHVKLESRVAEKAREPLACTRFRIAAVTPPPLRTLLPDVRRLR